MFGKERRQLQFHQARHRHLVRVESIVFSQHRWQRQYHRSADIADL